MKYLLNIALIVITFALNGYGQSNSWQITGRLPRGIYGAETVVVDSIIYVFGGYSDSIQKVTDWIYAFDPSKNTWTFLNRMKKRRRNLVAGKFNNSIIYAGGETDGMFRSNGIVEMYNPATNSVTVIDSSRIFNRFGAAGIISDSVFYIAGGQPYNPPPPEMNPYFFEYKLQNKSILFGESNCFFDRFPEEQMIASTGNFLYIMGGNLNTISRDIYRYNKERHWLVKLPMGLLSNRSGGRAILMNDSKQVMVMGGFNEISRALSTVELYDFSDTTRTITRNLSDLNIRRKHFMTAYVNGYIYVFGGEGDNGLPVLEIERYQVATDVQNNENPVPPSKYGLSQNYPNPFNGTTVINYILPESGKVSLKVYDVLGKEVSEVVNNEEQAGSHSITFNSDGLTSGIYFYRMTSNNSSVTKKMILMK